MKENKTIRSFRGLVVWQKAMECVVAVYELTENFPNEERFGLVSQMRRAAVSIPSNIAEGRMRGTRRDYIRFLRIAYGSGGELETQLEVAKRLKKTEAHDYSVVDSLLDEIMRMLNTMIRKLIAIS